MSTQLTARVSVRVQAKNTSQSNSQKRDTGKNIANALGNGNISDELADQIGNTSSPTIADENGNEWVKMEDIIAAGRKMKENGAFEEREVHKGLTDENNVNWNFGTVYFPAGTPVIYSDPSNHNSGYKYLIEENSQPATECYIAYARYQYESDTSPAKVYIFSKELPSSTIFYYRRDADDDRGRGGASVTLSATSTTINGVSYSFFVGSLSANKTDYNFNLAKLEQCGYSANTIQDTSDYIKCIAGYLFGAVETQGGSLIDWDKPDDEVEEDIRRLHETWDVSEHPGASGQGVGAGTYILAGPIEFNDADPTQGPPESG